MSNEFLWVEKYRPKTIDDIILPASLKKTCLEIIKTGEIQNMILAGTAGLGKTTVARALCEQLDLDYMLINASENGNIDMLRNQIRQFASTVSLSNSGYKVIILDEADYLNPNSTQPALRGFIEEFSKNCRFILTCNFRNRLIDPLHSRLPVYEFNTSKKDLPELCNQFFKRLCTILDTENIKYDQKSLISLIMKYAPDWRRVLGECQRYSVSGVIDHDILANLSDASFDSLFVALKSKNFKDMRRWVVNNIDTDASSIFRGIYDRMIDKVQPQTVPGLVLLLADYQYKQAFVADHELNVVACLTEIMSSCEFK